MPPPECFCPGGKPVSGESQPVTEVRRLPIQEGVSVMGQPGYMPCELPWEAVERIPWLRRRLLSWFESDGRSFPPRWLSRKSCCRGQPRPGSQRPTAGSSSTTRHGLLSRKHSWRSSKTRSGRSGSGGKKRWRFRVSHNRSWRTGASFPAHVRSWSACEVSAPTRRARCWPLCMGEPSRSSM